MRIIEYAPERRQDFIDLNVWWIERYFGDVERADWDEFDQIEDEIAKGGMVPIASTSLRIARFRRRYIYMRATASSASSRMISVGLREVTMLWRRWSNARKSGF